MFEPKLVPELKDYYEVEKDGRVWSKLKNRYLKQNVSEHGYMYVTVGKPKKKNIYVHRLVAYYYLNDRTEVKNEVHHIDGDRKNNHVSNLKWVDRGTNLKAMCLEQNVEYKCTRIRNYAINHLHKENWKIKDIASAFNLSTKYVISLIK